MCEFREVLDELIQTSQDHGYDNALGQCGTGTKERDVQSAMAKVVTLYNEETQLVQELAKTLKRLWQATPWELDCDKELWTEVKLALAKARLQRWKDNGWRYEDWPIEITRIPERNGLGSIKAVSGMEPLHKK